MSSQNANPAASDSTMALAPRTRHRRVRIGFAPRLALAISILIVATCSLLSFVVVRENLSQLQQRLLERTHSIGQQLARDGASAVAGGDIAKIEQLTAWAATQRDVARCSFVTANGRVLSAKGAPVRSDNLATDDASGDGDEPVAVSADQWEYRIPIFDPSPTAVADRPGEGLQRIGTVILGVTTENISALQLKVFFAAGSVTLLVAIFGVIAAMAIAQQMTRPLRRLVNAAEAVTDGNLDTEVHAASHTEIGLLADAFNTMVQSLRRSRDQVEESSRHLEETVRQRTEGLESANRDLAEANRLKSEFLATVSHELRTPLHVILGYAAMLEEGAAGPVTADQQELLAAIGRYSKLQLDLLTDVLDFSRLQSGKVSFHVERFELTTVLREVESLFANRVNGAGVRLAVRVSAATPSLETDRIKLQEIVRNLVDNAVKFTQRGEIVIEGFSRAGNESIVIQVTDTGRGIETAELPHVFEPFRQAEGYSTRATGGVGLGLSIVKQLAEALGGSCTASSQPGVGSTFRVTIPRRLRTATIVDDNFVELAAAKRYGHLH